jgi:hypothetical protein
MNGIAFPNFVDLHDISYAEYDAFIRDNEPYSDFNYVSAYSWNKPGNCKVSVLNGNLILSLKDYLSDQKVLSILGKNRLDESVVSLLEFARENKDYRVELSLVPESVVKALDPANTELEILEDIDNHDYILSAAEYMKLEGGKFVNKRKNINRFVRIQNGGVATECLPLTDTKLQNEILELTIRWKEWGTQGAQVAEDEVWAIKNLLSSADELSKHTALMCTALYIHDVLEGFCVWEPLHGYAITHFGKANINLKGSYEFLMTQTLRDIYSRYGIDKVNNEQDLGIPGLRMSKQSQKPVGYLRKYQVSLR